MWRKLKKVFEKPWTRMVAGGILGGGGGLIIYGLIGCGSS